MDNSSTKNEKIKIYAGWIAKCAALIVFDIVAGYFSFFLALVIRFYANGEFLRDAKIYLDTFYEIAPYSGAIILLLFALFGLYGSRWRYAGFNDLIRSVLAHATIFALMFAVTYLFFVRMPLTFYFLGTGMLFCLTCLSRFSLTIFFYLTRKVRGQSGSAANVMIVGTEDTANYVRRFIETREDSPARVKCFFTTNDSTPNTAINGIPILDNLEKLDRDLEKYGIDTVCFADPKLSADTVIKVTDICENAGIELRDYSDALTFDPYYLPFGKVMRHISGPVRIRNGSDVKDFRSAEEAVRNYPGSVKIEALSSVNGVTVIDIISKNTEKNDINEEWVKKTEADTGEKISFF